MPYKSPYTLNISNFVFFFEKIWILELFEKLDLWKCICVCLVCWCYKLLFLLRLSDSVSSSINMNIF